MGNYSDHNEDRPSSIAGISDTSNAKGDVNFVAALKRQGYLGGKKKYYDTVSFLALTQAMGPETLHKPFANVQLDDLRADNKVDGYFSFTLFGAVVAAARTLPYASEANLDIAAANFDGLFEPREPHLDIAA